MKLLFKNSFFVWIPLLFLSPALFAQEGTWTIAASGGFVSPSLNIVNETLDKTIRDWNDIQFVPVGPMGHFSTAPAFGVRAMYRYDRDVAVSFVAGYSSQALNASFRDTTVYLNLDRSIRTVDAMMGLAYYLPPLVFDMEVCILVDVGLTFARATAVTYNTRQQKNGSVYETVVVFDSEAIYKKTKLTANAGAHWTMGIVSPLFIKAEVMYRFTNVGKMNGEIRRLQGSIQEESITDFNFSGFSGQVGIGLIL